jgi:hypothetical protein
VACPSSCPRARAQWCSLEVHLFPLESEDLLLPHAGVEGQEENRLERLFRRCEEPLEARLVEHHPPDVRLPEELDAPQRMVLQLTGDGEDPDNLRPLDALPGTLLVAPRRTTGND